MFVQYGSALVFAIFLASSVQADWWRCDGDDIKSLAAEGQGPTAKSLVGNSAKRAEETPGAFVYDPLAGVSRPNSGSLRLSSDDRAKTSDAWETAKLPNLNDGFTLEAFVQAGETPTWDGAVIARLSGKAARAEIRVTRLGDYQWWTGLIQMDGKPPIILSRPVYMDLAHIRPNVWRHLALVHDPATKRVRLFIDYTPQGEATIDTPLSFNDATLLLGGQVGGRGLNGWLDEIRLSPKALEPWEFLRASPNDLKKVSFRPIPSERFPSDIGFVDLKLRFGAVGDGIADDTHAFRRAFEELASRVPIAYDTLFVAPGTYLVVDTVQWSRFLVVQGAGRDKTILKLKDKANGFGDPKSPRPIVVASDIRKRGGPGGSGNAIGSYLFDLTIDAGTGNPGAVALDFHANNHAAVENVLLRSGDGRGVAGLECTRPWCGPCLFKNLAIEGFDVGVLTDHREYSLVFSGLSLKGQNVVGIRNTNNLLSIEKLTSDNRVPVLVNKGGGLVVLLDSDLGGGSGAAIVNDAALYLRDIRLKGYDAALPGVAGPKIDEYHSHKAVSGHPSPGRSLNLPVSATPAPAIQPHREWLNVLAFKHLVKDGDWSAAIQAALDSGKATVYFPVNHHYLIRETVRVPAGVKRLVGALNSLSGDHKSLGDNAVLRIEGDTNEPLVIERLGVQRHGGGHKGKGLVHASKRPLVCEHVGLHEYTTEAGVGPVYFENVAAVFRFAHPQKIWARHLNPETHDIPEIINEGATLWILGLKTEYASVNIVNRKGAKTEVLGGLIYPVTPVPADMPMFINDESSLSLIVGVSAYPHNHRVYVQDTRDGRRIDVEGKLFGGLNGRPMIPLFTSYRK